MAKSNRVPLRMPKNASNSIEGLDLACSSFSPIQTRAQRRENSTRHPSDTNLLKRYQSRSVKIQHLENQVHEVQQQVHDYEQIGGVIPSTSQQQLENSRQHLFSLVAKLQDEHQQLKDELEAFPSPPASLLQSEDDDQPTVIKSASQQAQQSPGQSLHPIQHSTPYVGILAESPDEENVIDQQLFFPDARPVHYERFSLTEIKSVSRPLHSKSAPTSRRTSPTPDYTDNESDSSSEHSRTPSVRQINHHSGSHSKVAKRDEYLDQYHHIPCKSKCNDQ